MIMTLVYLDRGFARAAQTWSGSVISVLSAALVLAAVLALVLVKPRPPQTKLLVMVALVEVAGLGIVSLIGAFVGLADIGGGGPSLVVWFLQRLFDLSVVAVIAFVLLRTMMMIGAEVPAHPGQPHPGQQGGTSTQVTEPSGYYAPTMAPQQSPQQTGQAPQGGGWGTPQSLPPQGSAATPHSMPPQPPQQGQQYHQPGQPYQQQGQQPAHPGSQFPPQGQGPAEGGPPEDYTRIAPHRQP